MDLIVCHNACAQHRLSVLLSPSLTFLRSKVAITSQACLRQNRLETAAFVCVCVGRPDKFRHSLSMCLPLGSGMYSPEQLPV